MPRRLPQWTVMLIPQPDQRPVQFQLPTIIPMVLALVLLATVAAAIVWGHAYKALQVRVDELLHLESVNSAQRREIESMAQKARETDELLARLRALEQDIENLLKPDEETAPTAATVHTQEIEALSTIDPVGPTSATSAPLSVLSSIVPPETAAVLFSRRTSAIMASRSEPGRPRALGGSLEQAAAVTQLFEAQAREADHRLTTLTETRSALMKQRELLAHRPRGFPVAGNLTDSFGMRWSPFGWGRQRHYGIDIAAAYWDPIAATAPGTVVAAGWRAGGYGYTVVLDHGYGYQTLYAHMADYTVEPGEAIGRGQVIGYVGSSGLSTGPHVHYEVHQNGLEVDPIHYAQ